MRFFNTFIRVMLPKEIARKSQVLSLLYVLSFSALMISTLYTNSIPQAVLALLGTIYMTSYYTKKLTSPNRFLPLRGEASVLVHDFTDVRHTLKATVTLDREQQKLVLTPDDQIKVQQLFLQQNAKTNDFYRLMLQAKAQYEQLTALYAANSDVQVAEALGLVTLLHSHFIHGAEFIERALALPNSFPRKPTEAHTYILQLIRIALNRMDEAITHYENPEREEQFTKANAKMRETLRYVQG